MPPRFFLRFGLLALAELGFDRGRWEAEDLRLCALALRRLPPNPAAICFFESFRLAIFRPPGFAMIVSLVARAIRYPRTIRTT